MIRSLQILVEVDEDDLMGAMRGVGQEQEGEDARARFEFMDDATGPVSEVSLIALRRSYIYCRMRMQT